MKTRIFILGTKDNEKNKLFEFMLNNTFGQRLAADDAMGCYESVKEAIPGISKAFSDSEAVLFFAEKEIFAQVKTVLCRALGLKLAIDGDLIKTAENALPDESGNDEFAIAHAGIPEGGVAFGLSDALYTGFGVHKGRQTIVVLPVSVERTSTVLAGSVIPFLNDLYSDDIPVKYAECIFAYALQEKISGRDITIALSDTKTTALIKRYVSNTPELDLHMPVAAKGEKRGNTPPDEHVVNLSITAAEFKNAPYGVAMTNAFYTGDDAEGERVVYISVTNETESTVREVTSYYGESTPDLMNRCCGELCSLIGQIIDIDNGLLQKQPVEADSKNKGRGGFIAWLIILIAAIAAVCVFGYYYFTQHDYSIRDWLGSHIPAIFSETVDDVVTDGPTVDGSSES